MQIDLIPLKNNIIKEISIHEKVTFTKDDLKNTDLIDLKDVWVEGFFSKNAVENIELQLSIKGVMILPCSVTLKETEYPFEVKISDILDNLLEEIGQIEKKVENTIDILPIIWENILMEIPMKVVSKDAKFEKQQGDGWKLITEEETKKVINPAFDKLKDLL